MRLSRYIYLPLLCGILLFTWLIYSPGLHGGFLFDDFANLPSLGATGPIDRWETFCRYITSGHADPTGRPVALLSFLLDARDWPTSPYPFKRTNLLLHLLNGALLTLLLRRLGHSITCSKHQEPAKAGYLFRTDLAAVLGASLWLAHPLFVSTTLYVVQREAMLPATFTLIGLLLWLRARHAVLEGRTTIGLAGLVIGLSGCTLLATLSKANGMLLPTLALTIEYVLLRANQAAPSMAAATQEPPGWGVTGSATNALYRKAMFMLAWVPTAVIASYLVWQGWDGFAHDISSVRPWTLGQRLLTEPRVLMDYLQLLWLPRPFTPGLFNDQIQASVSFWSPATTLPAICGALGLIIASWLMRRRWPTLALAVLFYFVAQSLESSTVPLELYFEHRNYLPAMLMFWPLALWLCNVHLVSPQAAAPISDWHPSKAGSSDVVKVVLVMVILLGLGMMTRAGAELWGNVQDQALLWARLNPGSPRAQAYAAEVDMATDHPGHAIARLRPLLDRYPDQVQLALNLFGAECQLGNVSASTLNAALVSLRTARDPGSLLTNWFSRMIEQTSAPPCPELTYETIARLLDAALSNPHFTSNAGREQDIYYLKGQLALKQGEAKTALDDFNHALDLQVRISAALEQAASLGSAGYPRQGLAHLDHYAEVSKQESQPDFGMPRLHAWILLRQHYWSNEMAHLRATLQRDAARQTTTSQ